MDERELKRLEKLYLNRYMLMFYSYSNDDELVAFFHNPYEMSLVLGENHSKIKTLISNMKSGRINITTVCGRKCRLYLVDVIEGEENE